MADDKIGPDFDPVALGRIKGWRVETGIGKDDRLDVLVRFWDGGSLALRGEMAGPLTLDVRPATMLTDRVVDAFLKTVVPDQERTERIKKLYAGRFPENPELYVAAMKACHELGLPWTDPRTGVTHEPPKP
jgi:hypothetical protein